MANNFMRFSAPGREASFSILHYFDKGEPFSIQIDGQSGPISLNMISLSRGDGSGKEFMMLAKIVNGGSELYRVFYDTKTRCGWIAEADGPTTISMNLNGPTIAVKDGPSRDDIILSLSSNSNHDSPFDFSFEWNRIHLPRNAEVKILGVEKTSDQGWLVLLATVNNAGKNGKRVVIHYKFHERIGSVILVNE